MTGQAGPFSLSAGTAAWAAGANLAIADISTENLPSEFLVIKSDVTKVPIAPTWFPKP
jgi:hypothetical protein